MKTFDLQSLSILAKERLRNHLIKCVTRKQKRKCRRKVSDARTVLHCTIHYRGCTNACMHACTHLFLSYCLTIIIETIGDLTYTFWYKHRRYYVTFSVHFCVDYILFMYGEKCSGEGSVASPDAMYRVILLKSSCALLCLALSWQG